MMTITGVPVRGLGLVKVRVMIDGDYWWAEGADYDYGAQGDSYSEAVSNFIRGFEATIRLHIKRFGKFDPRRFEYKDGVTVKVPQHIIDAL